MLQRIEIIGNLVADAEVRPGQNQSEFVAFRVAVNESSGEEKKTTFYDVSYAKNGVFGYLRKGQQVYVSGRLSVSASNGKDGRAYLNAYINARDLELCGSPSRDN